MDSGRAEGQMEEYLTGLCKALAFTFRETEHNRGFFVFCFNWRLITLLLEKPVCRSGGNS